VTQEASSAPIDVLTIQLYEDAETAMGLVGDFAVLSNEDSSSDWVAFQRTIAIDMQGGRTLDFDIWAEADGSLVTDFYLDSLVVSMSVCD
jgi:hypothetical protein